MDLVSSTFSGGRKKIEAMLRIAFAKAVAALRALIAGQNFATSISAGIGSSLSITWSNNGAPFPFKSLGGANAKGPANAAVRVVGTMSVLASAVDDVVVFQLVRDPGGTGETLLGPAVNVAVGHVTAEATCTLEWIDTIPVVNPMPGTSYGIRATAPAGQTVSVPANGASLVLQEIAAS
jgi:hypothetical protein